MPIFAALCAILCSLGGTGLAFVIEAFSLLAVATSFIGTVLGLSEFLVEQLGKAQTSMSRRGRDLHRFPFTRDTHSNDSRLSVALAIIC